MRLASSSAVALVGFATLLGAGSCGEGNPGIDPPAAQMWFPAGLTLDPRVDVAGTGPCTVDADCGAGELCGSGGQCRTPSRWLFVTNANSDRRYNAGSLLAIDLDGYWQAAFADPSEVANAGTPIRWDPNRAAACGQVPEGRWCRRVANLPQVVECTEEPFVCADATVHFGNFPGPPSAWDPDPADDEATLLVPVRGDPSITYIELSGTDGDLRFECGQASDPDGRRKCDDLYRIRFLRNDPDSRRLAREPFRVLVVPDAEPPMAFVTHQGDQDLTLLSLEGLVVPPAPGEQASALEYDGVPAIVHQPNLLVNGLNQVSRSIQGGFGLAARPCDVESGNAPNSTAECSRPLVYASMRWQTEVRSFTAITRTPDDLDNCVGPDELGKTGGIICEPQVEPITQAPFTGLSIATVGLNPSAPLTGDIAFSRSGDELYVVQSNPGGLVRIDTSIGVSGEPLNVDVGVVETCSQPTTLVVYDDGDREYGLVTCYRSGEVFIVDLAALTVVGLSRAGIGPDAMAVDLAREVVYVANSLDATISIIDMGRQSASRFTEIGRIGLQEPYTQ